MKSLQTATLYSTDYSCLINLADPIATLVRNVDVSRGIDRDSHWESQFGRSCRASVPAKSHLTVTRDSTDGSRGINLADPKVSRVRDVHITGRIYRDSAWVI